MWRMLMAVAVLLSCFVFAGCGPSSTSIETGVLQTFQATNMSILSKVDWKQVATTLQGSIGPDFRVEVEAYTKASAGVDIRVHGGTVSVNTQASGTGGQDNSGLASWPEIVAAQQRFEKADAISQADKSRWTNEITAAILAHWNAAAATQPTATSKPTQ